LKYTDVSEVRTASTITMITETVRTSETSVFFSETTRRCIPEGCNLHKRSHSSSCVACLYVLSLSVEILVREQRR
jgi:hypothetical protein